ncbi:MAG: DUF983 domain-containing protein [Allomuricauda sp.]|jgi:uncharacterized protein (DUF983 family)
MEKIGCILKCKCPKCKNGNIFRNLKTILPFQMPEMYGRCPQCNYKFERETGFFFGAMFVSYALTAAQMVVCLVLFWYLIGLSPLKVFIIIVIMAVMLSSLNFKLSRTIWIYLFHRD